MTTHPTPPPFRAVGIRWDATCTDQAWIPSELDSERTLVLAFADPSLSAEGGPVRELIAALPRSTVLACSSAGEISGEFSEDGTVSGVVIRFSRGSLRWASAAVADRSSRDVGRELAAALAGPDLRGVFVLSDGLMVNGSQLAQGLEEGLPEGVCIAGGLAGDGERFASTWVAAGTAIASGVVAAVGLFGEGVRMSVMSGGGWAPFGPGRSVTRSEANVLYELDGEPALPLYRAYLGDYSAMLPGSALLFPLSVQGQNTGGAVVRTILSIDEAEGSMTFAGDVESGAVAHLMTCTLDRLSGAAAVAAEGAVEQLEPGCAPPAVVAVSCVGRRLAMGQRIDDELAAAYEALPAGSVQTGFYSYGEIAPGTGGPCQLHNQTITVVAITEQGAR